MRKWVSVLVAAALLAGCAAQPMDGSGGVAASEADSQSRERARAFTDLAGAYVARTQYKVALDELRKASRGKFPSRH
ncbi:lipoprotein [Thiobacillus sp.]|uniref:lipoprotein n=1 Tax=Thiobacillus sp. TaxID=924 RepID=UPI0025E1110E|nr:lipoprotein [Thiobacillus sp.]